jgi:hypothetical protein
MKPVKKEASFTSKMNMASRCIFCYRVKLLLRINGRIYSIKWKK